MASDKKKKIAAAIGAISLYLESETKTKELQVDENLMSYKNLEELQNVPINYISAWSLYGRSYSMNMRLFWQSKLYK